MDEPAHTPTAPRPPAQPSAASAPVYTERLTVSGGWWAIVGFLVFTFVVAVWAILDVVWALGALVLLGGLAALVLITYGGAQLRVDDSGVHVAGAHLGWAWVGGAKALDEMATRQVLAEASDGRTWLLVRPYLKRAVKIGVDDAADPHDQWLVATRHPEDFAEAITVGLKHHRADSRND
ncbi:DUF3093 domain-containing protein [Aestuariimicrobium sp. p3-SID1156]|uniref:DUF3093 domain-containing protein n=1 Tax=Aestuariimicrobium sp. p3-SID1156 TaxID=2916038 RepID=UPI00223B53F2|nr:DUF3093 domain-containing protein [Aestuariimicrobium sp. p3-SID1156]MCT1459038.1 DUF3093 domain-containing protein [Aestuariimicrobium sp. p3-SID1156]